MQSPEFPEEFIQELTAILCSEATSQHYDRNGKVVSTTREPFTGKWQLESLSFDPGTERFRVAATFRGNDKIAKAVIQADDFPHLVHGEHDPAFNSTQYSDLAFYVSLLLMEQLLTRDPAEVGAGEVRICSPVQRLG